MDNKCYRCDKKTQCSPSDSGKYKGFKCTKADNHEGRHTYVD